MIANVAARLWKGGKGRGSSLEPATKAIRTAEKAKEQINEKKAAQLKKKSDDLQVVLNITVLLSTLVAFMFIILLYHLTVIFVLCALHLTK